MRIFALYCASSTSKYCVLLIDMWVLVPWRVESLTHPFHPSFLFPPSPYRTMTKITDGVEFDTIAREWRCKWSPGDDDAKTSLQELQKALDDAVAEIKKVDGVKSVQRVVCGGCMDFKVIVALPESKFGDWESTKFAPEEDFLTKIKSIDGVTEVETQTYTLMPVEL